MTILETSDFMQKTLYQLWPKWKPQPAEVEVWAKLLEPLPREKAKAAAEDYYKGSGSRHAKPRPDFFKKCAKIGNMGENQFSQWQRRPAELRLAYSLKCVEHTNPLMVGRLMTFWNTPRDFGADPDQVEGWAKRMGVDVQRLYLGRWEYQLAHGGGGPILEQPKSPGPAFPANDMFPEKIETGIFDNPF